MLAEVTRFLRPDSLLSVKMYLPKQKVEGTPLPTQGDTGTRRAPMD